MTMIDTSISEMEDPIVGLERTQQQGARWHTPFETTRLEIETLQSHARQIYQAMQEIPSLAPHRADIHALVHGYQKWYDSLSADHDLDY